MSDEYFEASLSECLPDEADFDIERIYEDHKARVLKYQAMDLAKNGFFDRVNFSDALEKYLERNRQLRDVRNGVHKNPEIDYGKVAYTFALQLSNVTAFIILAHTPIWPMFLLTVPLFLGLNYYWLLKDSDGRQG